MKVVIESYLTEKKLAIAIAQLVGDKWTGGQVKLPGSRRRFDMAFVDNGTTTLIEYDGDEHYRDSLKIKADRQKDQLATDNGMRLIRVPYWVQLDQIMVHRLVRYQSRDRAIISARLHHYQTLPSLVL